MLDRADAHADTERSALEQVQVRRVRDAVAQLPGPQREAVALMDLSGCTAAQTASIVGVPRGTVLARVHRARKVLARTLADRWEEATR